MLGATSFLIIASELGKKSEESEKKQGGIHMKNSKILVTGMVILFLTACGSQTEKQAEKGNSNKQVEKTEQKKKAETTKNSDKTEHDDVQDKEQKNEQTAEQAPKFEQLTERERVALLFFEDDIADKSITAQDIMNEQYRYEGYQKETRPLEKVTIKPAFDMNNAPSGMKFYTLTTSKSNFATVIGVSDTRGMVGGTQGALMDYKELAETSVEFDLAPLYDTYQNSEDYQKVVEQLKFEPDDYSEQGEKAVTHARYRTQVYEEIAEFEGQPLDTDHYDWDPTLQIDEKGWTVTFRDKKTGDVAGYYTVKDGKIVKLDPRGQQINPAQ